MVTPVDVWKAGSRSSRGRRNREEGALRDEKVRAVGKKISGVAGERARRGAPSDKSDSGWSSARQKSRSDTTEASIQHLSSLGLSHGRSPFSDARKLIFRLVRSENSISDDMRVYPRGASRRL